MKKLFNSKRLERLYEKGKLNDVFKHFPDQINLQTWIGSGSEAAAFYYNHQVIKVCSKKIRFFEEAEHSSAQLFQDQVNQLKPFLVPINEILYENRHIVIYTQDRCQLLTSIFSYKKSISDGDQSLITPYISLSFLQLIIFMFENNQLVSDIGAHNLGLLNGQLVVFDYHGLHPIVKNGSICHQKWWKRPITNLSYFLSAIDFEGDDFLTRYDHFLEALPLCRTEKDFSAITKLLYECLYSMMNSILLDDKEWEKILIRHYLLKNHL
jgi:hypothetical protein